MRNLYVFISGLLLAMSGAAFTWAQDAPQPTKTYEPTLLQENDAREVIRKEISDGLEEAKKNGVDKDNNKNLATKRMTANEAYIKMEGFVRKLRKAYGGPVPDGLFDQAKMEFMNKDFNRVSDEVFKGNLNKDAVDAYCAALELANWRANYVDENKDNPFLVHLTDEELKDPTGALGGVDSNMANKVRQAVMDDIQKEWERSKGKDFGQVPTKTPGKMDEDDVYVAHVKSLCQDWVKQWGAGNDKNELRVPEFRKACLKADYLILTQDRLEFARKTGQPLAQGYVEGLLSTYVMAYFNCALEKSLTTFDFDVNKVLDDMLNGMANDIARDGIHRLLGF